ncbi:MULTISPECIES: class I SAM-dependent methyltransferase [Agrobacterium]|uniref:class I SAM-dependent methyltransferase n=1 Tax=Agrobacterium TaxID=357 RepID=UPI0009CD1D32|nr:MULTISPECIES: class I SAM-dependent methyltransferase [Agrobacterium]QCL75635.1 class I SAM-dependent methyltransferase [Agrobacterium tumefaciens]CUX57288.1 conserved hypothetical protein [Agrobacterium sp. NCPPB 925]
MPSLKQLKRAIRNMSTIDVDSISKISGMSTSVRSIEHGQVALNDGMTTLIDNVTNLADVLKAPKSSVLDGHVVFDYTYKPERRELHKGSAGKKLIDILDQGRSLYQSHLAGINDLSEWLKKIPTHGSPEDITPYWTNGWFEGLDGASLYYLIVKNNPSIYMEVGSGNSTKFVRKAIEDHGLRTKIVSIDPQPRADIDKLCDEVIRQKCEDVDPSIFSRLRPDDILFIDNSHRSFQGSDVTVFFTEILPALPRGILFGIHDIFIPYDYPPNWSDRFYNEQYLLLAYIFGGMGGGSIEFPVCHVSVSGEASTILADSLVSHTGIDGGAFWMRR